MMYETTVQRVSGVQPLYRGLEGKLYKIRGNFFTRGDRVQMHAFPGALDGFLGQSSEEGVTSVPCAKGAPLGCGKNVATK